VPDQVHFIRVIFPHSPLLSTPQDYGREGGDGLEIQSLLCIFRSLEVFLKD